MSLRGIVPAAVCATALLTLAVPAARAGATDDVMIGRLSIADLRASAAAAGADADLFMRVANDGYDDRHLNDVTSPVAHGARLLFMDPSHRVVQLQAIRIAADEVTEIDDRVLAIRLIDLRKSLRPGDRVPLTLHFIDGTKIDLDAPVAVSRAPCGG